MKRVATALATARRNAPRAPEITIGLPIPDEHFGTVVTFTPSDEEEASWVLACFVVKAEKIEALIREEMGEDRTPLGCVQLIQQDDGTFVVRWMDQNEMKMHERKV